MALDKTLDPFLSNLPPSILLLTSPVLLALGILTALYLYTTARYHQNLSIYSSSSSSAGAARSTKARPPPQIPYTIPILGHALAFLAPRPGEFWTNLFRSHPRATGACTLLLGGNHTHILFSPTAVQALFKTRGPGRDGFNLQVTVKGLGLDRGECLKYFGFGEGPDKTGLTPAQQQERLSHNYMLEKKSVNELTATFTRVLSEQLAGKLGGEGNEDAGEEQVVGIYAWLQDKLFSASTTAFMGSRILEVCPNLREDFFEFDRHMLTMFFGVPKLLKPTAYRVRQRALDGLIRWHQAMLVECNDNPVDPDGDVDWEPVYGSRIVRARQRYYASRGLGMRTRAGMDLGFLFGLSSNAIPAAGWMLMHILNPQGDASLLGRVMAELEQAVGADGSLDIPTLVALPLLHSIMHEVLRLYVDVLVTRELKEDLTLPLDGEGAGAQRHVLLQKDAIVMAPSWLGHRDASLWTDPPFDQFCAERFLAQEPETAGKAPHFSTAGTSGKFFPFGGGRTICPGRVFAKQEVLAAVALVLLEFDLEPLGFVDEQGKATQAFPGLRQSYSGSGIMATDADMKVRLTRRKGGKA